MPNLYMGIFLNITFLKQKKDLIVFDLGSAVNIEHPNSKEFIERDINNISHFFVKRGLTVENPSDVLERDNKLNFEKVIRIPSDRIGALIGKSGKTKSKIENACSVILEN